MLDTIKNIGKIVRNHPLGRIKYHILTRTYVTNDEDRPLGVYQINLDLWDRKVSINPEAINPENVTLIHNRLGSAPFPYLIGPLRVNVLKDKGKNVFSDNYTPEQLELMGVDNPRIKLACLVINDNLEKINNFVTEKLQDAEHDFVLDITINGKPFYSDETVLDSVDELVVSMVTEPTQQNGFIIMSNTLFPFFKTNAGVLSQSPFLNYEGSYKSFPMTVEDLIDLTYGFKFYNNTRDGWIIGKNFMTVLPRVGGMTYRDLEKFMEYRGKSDATEKAKPKGDIFRNIVDPLFEHALTLAEMKAQEVSKAQVNFDILIKQVGTQTTTDLLLISNINMTSIEAVNDKFNEAKKYASHGNFELKTSLSHAFKSFFEFPAKSDKYYKSITDWIVRVVTNKYFTNNIVDRFFIERMEFTIRNDHAAAQKTYNHLLINYKLLKYMERNGLENLNAAANSESYKLGYALGVICQTWQDKRENLVEYIRIFNGSVSRRIKNLKDVASHFNTVMQKLIINKADIKPWHVTNYHDLYNDFSEKFDQTMFIQGYLNAQYGYNAPKKEKTEEEQEPALVNESTTI